MIIKMVCDFNEDFLIEVCEKIFKNFCDDEKTILKGFCEDSKDFICEYLESEHSGQDYIFKWDCFSFKK